MDFLHKVKEEAVKYMTVAEIDSPETLTPEETAARLIEDGADVISRRDLGDNLDDDEFFYGLGGVTREHVSAGRVYQDVETFTDVMRFTGRIEYNPSHPVFDRFVELNAMLDGRATACQILPAPGALLIRVLDLSNWIPSTIYPASEHLAADIAAAYNATLAQLYALGCRNVLLNNTAARAIENQAFLDRLLIAGIDPKMFLEDVERMNEEAFKGLPADLTIVRE